MSNKKKRQKRVPGDIVKINLDLDMHTYAHVLEEALFAFYDCRVNNELSISQIISCPILFYIPVMKYAITSGHWEVVDHFPLNDSLKNPPPRFMQDQFKLENFSIYEKGKIRPATREECVGLEREAVWDPEHVEDRLRDHYAGRKNMWVESLKMKG